MQAMVFIAAMDSGLVWGRTLRQRPGKCSFIKSGPMRTARRDPVYPLRVLPHPPAKVAEAGGQDSFHQASCPSLFQTSLSALISWYKRQMLRPAGKGPK